jgi:hypothetical protein
MLIDMIMLKQGQWRAPCAGLPTRTGGDATREGERTPGAGPIGGGRRRDVGPRPATG